MASSSTGPTVQRVFLPTCDDENDTLRLECDVYRPPLLSSDNKALKTRTIKRSKDVFLLLHAHGKLGGSREMMKSYAILLAMRGFITYNVSFRGCDGNEKTSRASVFGEVDARDVLEMVKEIRKRESDFDDVEVKIHILGYSFGAAVGANAVGLLHEKLLSHNNIDFCKSESEEEERTVWSRCGIDGLILVAFPLGSLNPFATTSTIMGVLSRFLFGKHAGRLRKCFVKDARNRSLVARKTRLLFVHGQRDEFTRVKEVRKFCEKLAKGQPEEEDVNDDDDEENNDDEEFNENEFNEKQNNNLISDFFFGVEDDDDSDDDDSEKPVESSYETFGNTNGTSNAAPHLALLEIKGKKSDHFGFVKVKKQRDLLVKHISRFVLA